MADVVQCDCMVTKHLPTVVL